MALSNSVISQFVRVTNPRTTTSTESTHFGTVVEFNGDLYVQLDGSEVLTPVSTTANMKVGDRVAVMVKNHSATVTGNVTDPSASSGTVANLSEKVDHIEAEVGEFDTIYVKNADIDNIIADKINAETGNFGELYATKAEVAELYAEKAYVEKLIADEIDAEVIRADELYATKAEVATLDADVAYIETLMFGSATGDTIQTDFSNAVVAQIGEAQIESAMIKSLTASKITAGDIITNNVRVMSEDGSMIIADETIQISDENRVRVQIGKDASDDYSINIWDADGNLMFSEGGITDSAIKQAIIRDDMVSDTANISAGKINIDSLFEVINESSNTIYSTRIYLDDEEQTLDIAFKEMTTTTTELGETVTTHGTQIEVIQGQINSKIWQQDIDTSVDGATEQMSTQYSQLEQDLSGFKTTVSETYATKDTVNGIDERVSTNTTKIEQNTEAISLAVSKFDEYSTTEEMNAAIELSAEGINSSVSKTVIEAVDDIEVGGTNLIRNSTDMIFIDYRFDVETVSATDDGEGNVTIVQRLVESSADGEGNITLNDILSASDDDAGNVTLTA